MIKINNTSRKGLTVIFGMICATYAPIIWSQTAIAVRVEYPQSEYVEVKSDNQYCITSVTVHMRAINIKNYKVTQKLCRAHLQDLSLQGESAVDLQNGTASFGWELYIPFGRDEENFGDVVGNYVFVLGRNAVIKFEIRKN